MVRRDSRNNLAVPGCIEPAFHNFQSGIITAGIQEEETDHGGTESTAVF